MSNNGFLKPNEFYQREIDPLRQYVDQMSFYSSKMTGKSVEECKSNLLNSIREKKIETANDPTVVYFEREQYADRSVQRIPLSRYIGTIESEKLILAPSGTCYVSSDERESLLVDFTDENTKLRSIHKKKSFIAKSEGDMVLFTFEDNNQNSKKIYNNSLSGAFSTNGCVLKNQTAHSTLTSTTRTMTSIGNASNERIVAGNRHYRNPEVTLNNLINLAYNLKRESFDTMMKNYGIKYPSVEDTFNCVMDSSRLYWTDLKKEAKIKEFITKLDPVERAAIVYTGDLYHLRVHNEEFVREFISRLSKKVTDRTYENPIEVIKGTHESVVNYSHHICMDEVRGIGKDYLKLTEHQQNIVAGTCENIVEVIKHYKEMIDELFLTNNLPPTVAHITDMVRKTVVLSDTDSTMFSVDEWVKWYFGELNFTEAGFAVAGAIMFIATECISHSIAVFSANLNVKREKLFMAGMKPEYVFPVFIQTSVAKHYYTNKIVQEGNVFAEQEMEIKGVHLKNSALPKMIVEGAEKRMEAIIETVMKGGKVSLTEELRNVANLELMIKDSLLKGETTFYQLDKIKEAEAYGGPVEQSKYMHHILWMEVFAPKYGEIEKPVYSCIRVPTILHNKTATLKWLNEIEDQELSKRMAKWLSDRGKNNLATMYLSLPYVSAYGIPDEIKGIINTDRIILSTTISYRLILESLGYFPKVGMLIHEQIR